MPGVENGVSATTIFKSGGECVSERLISRDELAFSGNLDEAPAEKVKTRAFTRSPPRRSARPADGTLFGGQRGGIAGGATYSVGVGGGIAGYRGVAAAPITVSTAASSAVYSGRARSQTRVVAEISQVPIGSDAKVWDLQKQVTELKARAEKAEAALKANGGSIPADSGKPGMIPADPGMIPADNGKKNGTPPSKPADGAAALLYDQADLDRGMTRMEKALPIVYTIYTMTGGVVGPEVRAIVKHGSPPPKVTGTTAHVRMRGQGRPNTEGVTKKDPQHYPVDVYYVKLDPNKEYSAGEITVAGQRIPKITKNPTNWAVLGDTGLRVKKAENQFQPLDTWPAPRIGLAQANEKPDLVVHMGDYVYREGPGEAGCAGINATAEWGHTMFCWYAEFFEPFKPLLAAAPWIAARGNHENNKRLGPGWHFLLGTDDWVPSQEMWSRDPESWCPHNAKPFVVEFKESVVYSVDNGDHHEKSIDHYNFDDAKSAAKPGAKTITIDPEANHSTDIAAHKDDAILQEAYHVFSRHATDARKTGKTTFLLQHIPCFAVVCDGAKWVGYNPNVQRAFWDGWQNPAALTAILSGHMHWYERWGPKGRDVHMPMQFVIGNSGTMLIPECGVPPNAPDQTLVMKKLVKDREVAQIPIDGHIVRGFGYSMFRQHMGTFECVHYVEEGTGSFKPADKCSLK